MKVINLSKKLELFNEHWNPKIVGELNGQHVKLAKIQGDFIWHKHEHEDELFYVIKGTLYMDFRDKTVELKPGEMLIVPKGIEHKPRTDEEVHIMLFEPINTVNTGGIVNEKTRGKLDEL